MICSSLRSASCSSCSECHFFTTGYLNISCCTESQYASFQNFSIFQISWFLMRSTMNSLFFFGRNDTDDCGWCRVPDAFSSSLLPLVSGRSFSFDCSNSSSSFLVSNSMTLFFFTYRLCDIIITNLAGLISNGLEVCIASKNKLINSTKPKNWFFCNSRPYSVFRCRLMINANAKRPYGVDRLSKHFSLNCLYSSSVNWINANESLLSLLSLLVAAVLSLVSPLSFSVFFTFRLWLL
mmetsp:Transcript_16410/g.25944  ORF Transcript_16410/g.25944 Transcript_16410/m.25944 type:complete len:237 (-) Transcript_16410:168-878(-)